MFNSKIMDLVNIKHFTHIIRTFPFTLAASNWTHTGTRRGGVGVTVGSTQFVYTLHHGVKLALPNFQSQLEFSILIKSPMPNALGPKSLNSYNL